MTRGAFTPIRLSLFGFLAVLVLTWFCYRPALSGDFQLDDGPNLAGLAAIEDFSSAADFVFSGTAGPSGRPLALLTFALQAEHWEQGAEAFLRVNILIHLLNALLLAACLYQLTLMQSIDRNKAVIVATAAAACWVSMPLLASASLLVVQRMATLSSFFILLGLAGYLLARRKIDAAPRSALVWMTLSLGAGTVLATLSKEIGFLLPAYILVLEATVLRRPDGVPLRHWRVWQGVFLVLPTLIFVVYLAMQFSYPEWIVARRGFTGWERLLTETQLLWVYVQKALFGIQSGLGIYQTPPEASRNLFEPLALLAVAAWLGLSLLAVMWRRRFPLFSLAILWYLAGHMMESSVLPLELYFEHRNYLPIAGPVYALVVATLAGPARLQRVASVAIAMFILVNAYFLYQFASLAGEPSTASRYWAIKYPESVRAVTTMASYELSEEGPIKALSTIDRFVIQQPQHAYLRILELNLRCMYLPDEDHTVVLEEMRRDLPDVEFTYTAGTMLSQLFSTVIAGECNGIDAGTVTELAQLLRENPHYVLDPDYNQFHYKLMAGISRQQGRTQATIENLEKAIAFRGSSELNMMMVTTLAGAGEFDAARAFIATALEQKPANPFRAWVWRGDLEELRNYTDELERNSN